MRLAILSTKGGSGKTTTSVHLGMALHRSGRILAVDADHETRSLRAWHEVSEQGSLPFPVVGLDSPQLLRTLPGVAGDHEHVIIDGPPGDLKTTGAAAMQVQLVIVPVSPTGLDLNRLMPTFELLASVEPVHPVDVGVLLTKVRAGTRSAREAKAILEDLDYPLLETQIPLAEAIAGTFGTAPAELGAYEDLLAELKA